jgi:hypothetical protein
MLFYATGMLSTVDGPGDYSNFEQQFRRLAVSFKDTPSVMIAKMDIEANEIDHPQLAVGTLKPSIVLLKDSDKQGPVVYNYGKEIDAAAMVEFLEEHAIRINAGSGGADEGEL